jgi:cytochrome c6
MKRLAIAIALAVAGTSARASDAAALYQSKCKLCHGADGKGSPVGLKLGAKDLTTSAAPEAEMAKVIAEGRGKMTPFKSKLSDEEISSLAKYVRAGLK